MTTSITPSQTVLIAGSHSQTINYQNALKSAGYNIVLPHFRNFGSPILHDLTTLSFDLLLLPGGGDISARLYDASTDQSLCPDYVTDLMQFQLLQLALLQKKPILGICKGMQMLNIYFGGSLHTHLTTASMHCQKDADLFHPLFFSPEFPHHCPVLTSHSKAGTTLQQILQTCTLVNSSHHQGVYSLGNGLHTLQYSEDYLPETIAHESLPILGLQWHPERLPGFASKYFPQIIHLLLQSAHM